jgi:hypothetical protein
MYHRKVDNPAECPVCETRRIYRRWAFFFAVVWRPTWPPSEAGWWEAHWTYRLRVGTAREVAGVGLSKPRGTSGGASPQRRKEA